MQDRATVTVCSNCLRASCWQGYFYCDNALEAGTREESRDRLAALDREHPDHWSEEEAGDE